MIQFELLCAGFGGQGVMLMGQLLAYAAAMEDKEATWFPSYGPEMRGGTANCQVVISDTPISSPILSHPETVIALNKPSFQKYEPLVCSGGLLLVNSSLNDVKSSRTDLEIYEIPATEMANDLGGTIVTNIVLLGAYLERVPAVRWESVEKVLHKLLSGPKERFLPMNLEALHRGAEMMRALRLSSGKGAGSEEKQGSVHVEP
jgi:2-oxoglutarate ferredoxin oxidoreductase subunit gamma